MKKKLLYLAILTILFVGRGVLRWIGWTEKTFFPMRYDIFVYMLLPFLFTINMRKFSYLREECHLLIMFLFVAVFSLGLGRLGSVSVLFGILFPSVVLSVALNQFNKRVLKFFIRKCLILFYVIECFMAIMEKISGKNFLGYDYSGAEDLFYAFRSSALHGHPLSNALLVSIIMSFILIDSYYGYIKKIMLYILGIIALLCFNTRSSIIVMSSIFLIHFTFNMFTSKYGVLKKIHYLILVYIAVAGITYLMFVSGIGGRLMERELMDNSANTRLEIVDVYLNLPLSDMLLGVGNQQILWIAEQKVNGGHAENYWILFAASFGLVLFFPMVYLFYKLYKKYFVGAGNMATFITVGTFIVISSTNNSLFFQAAPLCVFLLCAYAMLPKLNNIGINTL